MRNAVRHRTPPVDDGLRDRKNNNRRRFEIRRGPTSNANEQNTNSKKTADREGPLEQVNAVAENHAAKVSNAPAPKRQNGAEYFRAQVSGWKYGHPTHGCQKTMHWLNK